MQSNLDNFVSLHAQSSTAINDPDSESSISENSFESDNEEESK